MEPELTCQQELVSNADNLPEIARQIIDFAGNTPVWLFEGPMGAGKTTLIKAIGKEMGVKDAIASPTFSLVNEYHNKKGEVVYHFDFYRIKDEEEACDIGIDEYFYSDDYCFVEWPSMIASLWPDEYIYIAITILSETERKICLSRKQEA
jgi:tRNA threonylcarbamoyladenosine biosynthesis protein TsaE